MVSSITSTDRWVTPLWTGFKDITRFCWDPAQNSAFSDSLKDSTKGVADKVTGKRPGGNGLTNIASDSKKAWADSKEAVKGTSFFGSMWESLKSIPSDISKEVSGAKGLWGKTKAIGKVFAKKMPLIGNLITVVTEIPNVYRAFRDGGFGAGMAEMGKSALKIGAFAIGCAVGTAFGGLIGGMALGMVADSIMRKFTGKTFTEKQEEAKAAETTTEKTNIFDTTGKEAVTEDPSKANSTAAKEATAYNNSAVAGINNYNMMPDFSGATGVDSSSAYNNPSFTGLNFNQAGAYNMPGGYNNSLFNNTTNPLLNSSYADEDFYSMGLFNKTAK